VGCGIKNEGESFKLIVREYGLRGRRNKETYVTSIDGGSEMVHEDLWPDLDISKFGIMQ